MATEVEAPVELAEAPVNGAAAEGSISKADSAKAGEASSAEAEAEAEAEAVNDAIDGGAKAEGAGGEEGGAAEAAAAAAGDEPSSGGEAAAAASSKEAEEEPAAADGAKAKEQQQSSGGDADGAPAKPAASAPRNVANPLGASKGSIMGIAAPSNPHAEIVRSCDAAEEVRSSPVKVTELAKELKEQFESGGSAGNGGAAAAGDAGREPGLSASRASSGVALTQHDLVNTANVALVLQAGEFKLKPGVDFVPYDELKELRLEDGLDVSRKEEYLSNEEFEKIFGMDKEEFKGMPAWKRINAKKSKGLF